MLDESDFGRSWLDWESRRVPVARAGLGIDVLICDPWLVRTGLDLIEFPTICWLETELAVSQSTRRAALPVRPELAVCPLI